jgi:hypothetical protein
MTIKESLHTYTHKRGDQTTDTKILTLVIEGKSEFPVKFKFSYRSYNWGEDFTGEIFDGTQLNHVFDRNDLGITIDPRVYYGSDESEHKARVAMLTLKGIEFIKSLF